MLSDIILEVTNFYVRWSSYNIVSNRVTEEAIEKTGCFFCMGSINRRQANKIVPDRLTKNHYIQKASMIGPEQLF